MSINTNCRDTSYKARAKVYLPKYIVEGTLSEEAKYEVIRVKDSKAPKYEKNSNGQYIKTKSINLIVETKDFLKNDIIDYIDGIITYFGNSYRIKDITEDDDNMQKGMVKKRLNSIKYITIKR